MLQPPFQVCEVGFQVPFVLLERHPLGLVRHTPQTITDPEKLRKELAQVRAQGYAVDNTEHQPDVRCVAAPIRNSAGKVIAPLSISGPATRIPRGRFPVLAARLCEVTAKLSARLGYRGP